MGMFRFFVLLTLIGILAILLYLGELVKQQGGIQADWYSAQACQLPEQSCITDLGRDHRLTFRLLTAQPLPLEPLPLEVQLEGWSDAALDQLYLEVDLQGRDMYMGYNRTPLTHLGAGRFSGTPRLSLCTDDVMVWRAIILIYSHSETPQRPQATYFDFIVDQRKERGLN